MSLSMKEQGKSLQGAYTIVTGGNKGIGYETVRGLMAEGAHVVMAARDQQACKAAAERLSQMKLSGTCSCARLDLEDFDSIREFAKETEQELKKRKQPLRVLVNNAGVMGVGYQQSGADRHMMCNHVGPFLLTRCLVDSMQDGSRVVNVASRAHYQGRIEFDGQGNVVMKPNVWWLWRYSSSKLANVLFTSELQRRYNGQDNRMPRLVSVSVSPGFVSTGIFSNLPWPLNTLSPVVTPLIARTPAQGAETVIWAATSPDVTGDVKQVFVHDFQPKEPHAAVKDAKISQQLWDWTERITGLSSTQ